MSTGTHKDRGGLAIERWTDELAAYLENQSAVSALRENDMPEFPGQTATTRCWRTWCDDQRKWPSPMDGPLLTCGWQSTPGSKARSPLLPSLHHIRRRTRLTGHPDSRPSAGSGCRRPFGSAQWQPTGLCRPTATGGTEHVVFDGIYPLAVDVARLVEFDASVPSNPAQSGFAHTWSMAQETMILSGSIQHIAE